MNSVDIAKIETELAELKKELGEARLESTKFSMLVEGRLSAIETNIKWIMWLLCTIAISMIGLFLKNLL